MAVAFDGEAVLSAHVSASTTWTASGKTTAGSDRAGTVRVMGLTTSGAPSSVTWGGSAMSLETSFAGVGPSDASTFYLYRIAAPPTASSDVVINWSGSTTGDYFVASYNGVNQSDIFGDIQVAAGSSTTPTIAITSATGDMVLDMMITLGGYNSTGADQTKEGGTLDGGIYHAVASREAGASSVTMSWGAGNAAWDIFGASMNQVAAGGNAPRARFYEMMRTA